MKADDPYTKCAEPGFVSACTQIRRTRSPPGRRDLLNPAGLQVVRLPSFHRRVIGFTLDNGLRPVVEVNFVLADNLGGMAADDDRRRFVQADPQELRMRGNDLRHIGETLALGEMLIDGCSG